MHKHLTNVFPPDCCYPQHKLAEQYDSWEEFEKGLEMSKSGMGYHKHTHAKREIVFFWKNKELEITKARCKEGRRKVTLSHFYSISGK